MEEGDYVNLAVVRTVEELYPDLDMTSTSVLHRGVTMVVRFVRMHELVIETIEN